jgi:hydroxypyruvate isomerase
MVLELSASLPALYGGVGFAAACAAAAQDGFRFVEMWQVPPRQLWLQALRALDSASLTLTSVNSDAGVPPAFGVAADPSRATGWRADFLDTLEFARRGGAAAINVLAGARVPGQTRSAQLECLRANLEWAIGQLVADDPVLLLEPLNGVDRASPLLCRVDDVLDLVARMDSARLRMLFDAYHVHQEEPDLLTAFDRALPHLGHIQIADFPGRGEPDSAAMPWRAFLPRVARSGYRGRIGCEFVPTHPDAIPAARAALTAALTAETADA